VGGGRETFQGEYTAKLHVGGWGGLGMGRRKDGRDGDEMGREDEGGNHAELGAPRCGAVHGGHPHQYRRGLIARGPQDARRQTLWIVGRGEEGDGMN
jgi:hypothetical protein